MEKRRLVRSIILTTIFQSDSTSEQVWFLWLFYSQLLAHWGLTAHTPKPGHLPKLPNSSN